MKNFESIPPLWAVRLLKMICPTKSFEEIEGDLTQEFYRDLERFGLKRARREFAWNVVRYARPEILLRNHFSLEINSLAMILNYLRIAIRSLLKQKALAFINVFGLAVGISCFCLLLLFAINEFSFDKFHVNAANIYRAYTVWDASAWGKADESEIDYTEYSSFTKQTLAEAMKKELPDVVDYVQMQLPWTENLVRANNKVLHAEVGFADPQFFSVFNFPLKYGNKATALRDAHDIVLTSSRAKTIFGTDEVIGKFVEIQLGNSFYQFTVSGVAEDVPENSSIRFDIIGSFSFTDSHSPDSFIIGSNWHPTVKQTYVLLKPGSKLSNDPKALSRFLQTYTPLSMFKDMGATNWNKKELPVTLKLQPLLDIHTDSWFNGYAFTDYEVINPKAIWILLTIAAGILLIACINFTTLAIGRSAARSKEVGIRKVIGAAKFQVIFQFFAEALLLSFFSAILGLILAYLFLPWFNQLSGRSLSLSLFLYPQMILMLFGLVVIVGFLAGSYPALVLSNFKPVEVLKNKLRMGGSNFFTKSLVTLQFALSITLIVSTIIILQQTNYLKNGTTGFNRENVVAIDATEVDPNKVFPIFKQDVIAHSEIVGVSSAAAGLGAGKDLLGYSDQGLSAAVNIVDADYIKLLGMKLIAGRDFEPVAANDTVRRVIINETMAHAFGWAPQDAVGQKIKHFQGRTAHVIGVVKNFSYRPLSEGIKNQLFMTTPDKGYSYFYIRINSRNATALVAIKKAWGVAAPDVPMKFSFLDEDVDKYYRSEQRWSAIVGWAGGISIFLACLGLLGLVALAAVNRTKEVGIRKVLGASVVNIANLLMSDFLKLILIAFALSSPAAWYFMNNWLQGYANRITVHWTIFLIAGVLSISVALLTISFQVIKVALANPVKNLKIE